MVKFVLAMAIAAVATSAEAYEIRCQTHYYWNSSYSRCVPWYSEQEIYQQNQAATVRDLNSSSRGGTRRASEAACQRALEAGVTADVTMSYGCRE
jgi:hypothetical protein